MSEPHSDKPAESRSARSERERLARQAREAEALRENLRKRKQQVRLRAEQAPAAPVDE